MAIYHLHLKKSSKSKNINGKGFKHAQYILREGDYENKENRHEKYILREGEFDKKNDLEYKEHGNTPNFVKEDPIEFWKSAEKYERKNGVIYREFEIALPTEFTKEQNIELVKEFVEKELRKDYVYTFVIHKPKSSTKKDLDQPHTHIMFCDRKLDGIERTEEKFFKRYNSKKPEQGGAKKENEWQTKEKLLDLRKSWEVTLNSHLEKNNINQKVSSETLARQREKYLMEGNQLEADRLDREAINIDGRILYKKEKDLTGYEKKLKEDFFEKIRLKEIKENIYNLIKGKEDSSTKNEAKDLSEKSINELEKDKLELIKQIEKLQINSSYENLKKTSINQLTNRNLYNLLNENKRVDKESKKLRKEIHEEKDEAKKEILNSKILGLDIKRDIILKEYNSILSSYDSDAQKKNQLIRKMESIKKSYKAKELKKREIVSSIERLLIEKKEISKVVKDTTLNENNKKHILKKLVKEYEKKGYKDIYLAKEEIKKRVLKLEQNQDVRNIEKIVLDKLSNAVYSKLLSENEKLYLKVEILEVEFDKISSLKFLAKESKRKELNAAINKYKENKSRIKRIEEELKNQDDFDKKKEELILLYKERAELEKEKLDSLEVIEKMRIQDIKKDKSKKLENKKTKRKILGDESGVGVSFYLKKQYDDIEEKEEELER